MRARRALVVVGVMVGVVLAASCAGGGEPEPADGSGPAATPPSTIRRATEAEIPLTAGQCGDVPRVRPGAPLDPASIVFVGCDQPHVLEVAVVFEYPASSAVPFPGPAAVDGYANDECLARFEDYVGVPFEESRLDVTIVAPDEAGWQAGDRRVACLVYDTDFAPLTGSVAGTGT